MPPLSLPHTGTIEVSVTAPPKSTSATAYTTEPTEIPETALAADRNLFLGEDLESQTPMKDHNMSDNDIGDDDMNDHKDDDNYLDPTLRFGQYDTQNYFLAHT